MKAGALNPHTGRDFVQFGKTESVLNKGAKKIALLFNPPPVLSLEIIIEDLMLNSYLQKNFHTLRTPDHIGQGFLLYCYFVFTLTVMDRYESSSLRFLLNAVTATKIPDNIMVNVVLLDV